MPTSMDFIQQSSVESREEFRKELLRSPLDLQHDIQRHLAETEKNLKTDGIKELIDLMRESQT
jgi:uncharacterized protein (DUF2461 family)